MEMEGEEEEEEEEQGRRVCAAAADLSLRPSRLILLLINGAVCRASQGKSGAPLPFTEPPFICPQQMGPLGPAAHLHLMRSASFILISEHVPEQEPPDLQVTSVTCQPSQSYSKKTMAHTPALSGRFSLFPFCPYWDIVTQTFS